MISFQVNDMTCGHCASSITQAVKALDRDAIVQVDLATHRVMIDASHSSAEQLGEAIRQAGFAPVAFDDSAGSPGNFSSSTI